MGQAVAAVEVVGSLMEPIERDRVVKVLRLWEFGKWALLGNSSAQQIKRQLQYQPRNKESMTHWQSIMPMSDDDACEFDRMLCQVCTPLERNVIHCAYQYHQSEDAGARILSIGRYQFRSVRDEALGKLRDHKNI